MRIISQNGNIDFPYENIAVAHAGERVAVKHDGKDYIVAEYSSKEKAYKVMEMLRDKYMHWKCFSVLANGTCEHMENSFSSEEFPNKVAEFCEMNVFQFPKDEKIEV